MSDESGRHRRVSKGRHLVVSDGIGSVEAVETQGRHAQVKAARLDPIKASPRRRPTRVLMATGLGAVVLLIAGVAVAVHDVGLFELDGNVADDVLPLGDDWENLDDGVGDPNNDDNAVVSTFIFDDGVDGINDLKEINFLGGGSKDDLDIPNWEWDTSPVPNKNDIMTAGAALYTSGGDSIIYFFLDRFSGGVGDADVGFWFFEGTHNLVPNPGDDTKGTFEGFHSIGDILVLTEFTIGGGVSTVKVLEWVGDNNGSESSTTPPAPPQCLLPIRSTM